MPKLPSFTVVSGQIGVTKDLRRFTLAEYQHLIELGIFGEDERLELIDGLVVERSPIRPSHAACVDNLNGLINHLLYNKAWVRVQAPITIERRSDAVIAILQPEVYEERQVRAEEISLLIEVADSLLHGDKTDKLELYAAAGFLNTGLLT